MALSFVVAAAAGQVPLPLSPSSIPVEKVPEAAVQTGYKKHLKAGGAVGYEHYFSSSHEKVIAGLKDVGENKIYRMTRGTQSQLDRHAHQQAQKKLRKAHELLKKQGFLHSSVSLADLSKLGLEVQLVSCNDYSGTEVQRMLLGDGDSRPNSLRFDFLSCAPLDKKDKATGKGNGKESPAIFFRAVALSCCGEDKLSNDDSLALIKALIRGSLDEKAVLAADDSDGDDEFVEAKDTVKEVSAVETRGDQGPPLVPDEKSSLAVSKWSGLLTDDVPTDALLIIGVGVAFLLLQRCISPIFHALQVAGRGIILLLQRCRRPAVDVESSASSSAADEDSNDYGEPGDTDDEDNLMFHGSVAAPKPPVVVVPGSKPRGGVKYNTLGRLGTTLTRIGDVAADKTPTITPTRSKVKNTKKKLAPVRPPTRTRADHQVNASASPEETATVPARVVTYEEYIRESGPDTDGAMALATSTPLLSKSNSKASLTDLVDLEPAQDNIVVNTRAKTKAMKEALKTQDNAEQNNDGENESDSSGDGQSQSNKSNKSSKSSKSTRG